MVNEFKLTVVHVAHQNPMQICACAWIYRRTENGGNQDFGPPGRWAVGLLLAKPKNLAFVGFTSFQQNILKGEIEN